MPHAQARLVARCDSAARGGDGQPPTSEAPERSREPVRWRHLDYRTQASSIVLLHLARRISPVSPRNQHWRSYSREVATEILLPAVAYLRPCWTLFLRTSTLSK